jgi:hypothetical protein
VHGFPVEDAKIDCLVLAGQWPIAPYAAVRLTSTQAIASLAAPVRAAEEREIVNEQHLREEAS